MVHLAQIFRPVTGALLCAVVTMLGGLAWGAVSMVAMFTLWNTVFRWFWHAQPLTTRQIPPCPIRRCQQLSAVELSRAYETGELSCVEVVQAYIDVIRHVNPYTNAMVYECFDEALDAARKADKVWARWRSDPAKYPKPSWLLGVPCTVKESVAVKNFPSCSGHPGRVNNISTADAPIVSNYRKAGAIILGTTNTSELCMWMESSNYVYGITSNPYDVRCLVGGSSGGEGSASGAAFAAFSLGSDIGGSIRMPCVFNGVFGVKASPHYVPNGGQFPGAQASANHFIGTGPITRFGTDLIPLLRVAAANGFGEDPVECPPCPALPERPLDLKKLKKLRVFALVDFGAPEVYPSASQVEAVHMAAKCLEEEYGAEVMYINVRDPSRCTNGVLPEVFLPFRNIFAMWAAMLTGDPSEVKFSEMMGVNFSVTGVSPVAELLRWFLGCSQHTLPAIALCLLEAFEHMMPSSVIAGRKRELAMFKAALEELLGDDGVIIAPTYPKPAPRHHEPLQFPFQWQYTAAFNVLQLPATAVPVWPAALRGMRVAPGPQACREKGLPADYHLPKGVQVVTRQNHDILSVSVSTALERHLGGYKYPSWAVLEDA